MPPSQAASALPPAESSSDWDYRESATAKADRFAGLDPNLVRWGRRVLVVLGYCLATIVMTRPWITKLGSDLPAGGDPLLQIWISRWVQHALITDPLHLYNTNAFYPMKYSLAYSDSNIPAGIAAAPIYLLTGNAVLANNLLVLGTFVVAATGMYALLSTLAGNRAVAFLAGLAYAFIPYRYAHIWHLNQLGHAWTPWALLALVLLIQRQQWRYAVGFGLLCALQVLTSFYVGFQLAFVIAITIVVALFVAPSVRTLRFWVQFVAAALLALALIVPLAWPYIAVRDQQGLERTITEAENFQAVPESYLRVQPGNRFWTNLTEKKGGEDTLFPGGLVILGTILGLIGFRRRPAVTTAALLFVIIGVILSLGPTWQPSRPDGGSPLPYRLLFDHFPFFKAMRVPARFGAIALLGLVVLAGCGAAWAWDLLRTRLALRQRWLIGAGVTVLLAVMVMTELFTQVRLVKLDTSAETAAPYLWLAAQPGNDPMMEFPAAVNDPAALMMYWSTYHWKPIVGGYSGFVPRAHDELIQSFSSDLKRPDGTVATDVSYLKKENIGVLQALGVHYILVHRDGYKREDWSTVVAQLEGTGVVEKAEDFGESVIYLLQPPTGRPTPVTIDLYAPGIVQVGQFWEPGFVARNTTDHQELFFSERPLTLNTIWRDSGGKVVRHDTLPLSLPAVLPPGELFCSVRACPTKLGASLPETGPDSPHLYPQQPGTYNVELQVSGGGQQSRTVTVEVVNDLPAPAADGPPLALNEVVLSNDAPTPVTALAMVLSWETRQSINEDLTVFAQLIGPDGKVWGQFDAPAGWTGHYTSAWQPGERLTLPWAVTLQEGAPAGPYRLLLGVYRHAGSGVERVPLAYPSGVGTEYWAAEITVP